MPGRFGWRGLAVAAAAAVVVVVAAQQSTRRDARENAYRANNVGVALLEQFNYAAAADAFRRALSLERSLPLAHLNLAIALLYVPDLDAARAEAVAAQRLLPGDPRPHYVAGLVAREQGRGDEARAEFDQVLRSDAHDVGSHVNVGQLLLQQQQLADAIGHFRAALADEPYNVTAAYNLGLALTRAGQREEGQQAMERSQQLRTSGYGTVFSTTYLEQGRYAEAMASTGAERDLVDSAVPDISFAAAVIARDDAPAGDAAAEDVSARGLAAIDADGDGDPDLLVAGPRGLRLLRNDHGTFVDVTREARLDSIGVGVRGCVAGDYDNDGRPDVFVIRSGGNLLLHNDGGGRFSDATTKAGLAAYRHVATAAAFVDIDHDGDLDLVVAGGGTASLQVQRNNGNGTFTDVTRDARLADPLHAIAVIPTDFDNRRDVDLLAVNDSGSPALFKNLRDGTFRDVVADTGLRVDGTVRSAAAADFNKDDYPDFFFGRGGAAGVFGQSDGRGRFTMSDAPAATADALAAQFVDYDDDGLLDLLTWHADGPRLFRRIADGWSDVTARAFPRNNGAPRTLASARALIAADFDDDGREDLATVDGNGSVVVWRNDGGRHTAVRVTLAGRVSNRLGIGSKVELRAGSLRQRLELSASTPAAAPADVRFGLGTRAGADVIRVLWPSGVLQSETPAEGQTMLPPRIQVQELDRKPSSCPFLFTWNGREFEFVTDFLGAGEIGYWEAPGIRNHPDPEEYVRIRGDQLTARDGRYELRVTNELEEALFLDRVQLLAIAHPAGVDVFPNEGMIEPPRPFQLFAASGSYPPRRAVDEAGRDLTDAVSRVDGRYAGGFGVRAIRGYADEHSVLISLDPHRPAPDLLLLTGWTDYAFSTDNVAASQSGLSLRPPHIDARSAGRAWRTVIDDIGIPVGRPQTLVADLRGRLPADASELRIVTNMRIYWDEVRLARAANPAVLRVERMDPADAMLRSRGFSEARHSEPPQPLTYDYSRVTTTSPWKTLIGAYTREGNVRPLVERSDDRFVVSAPGDEIAVSFDAMRLSGLPAGWTRTFLLYADGFSKEMDLHSASPDTVAPLPFHGMAAYPYSATERRASSPAYQRYVEEFNIRAIRRTLPLLDRSWPGAATERTAGAAALHSFHGDR